MGAHAQSACQWMHYGYVPTVGQWNQCWQAKQDLLGYTPLNAAGGTMTGKLTTAPSSSAQAGFNLTPGSAPSSPQNGDWWVTAVGFYGQVNGATVGPFVGSNLTIPQVINLNTAGSPPTSLTGAGVQLVQANSIISRYEADAWSAPAGFSAVRYDGGISGPTQVLAGDMIADYNGWAYNGAAVVGPIGGTQVVAAENIASGHQGSRYCLRTTPTGSTTIANGYCQQPSGGGTLGSPTGGDEGSGTVNAAGGFYVNGTKTPAVTLPPLAINAVPSICSGSPGDAAAINPLLASGLVAGLPLNQTCQLSTALSLGNGYSGLLGGGYSSILTPSASTTTLVDIGYSGGAYSNVHDMSMENSGSLATDGIHYHNNTGDSFPHIHDNFFLSLTNGVLDDATAPGGDGLRVHDNFFQAMSGYAVNLANGGVNASIHSNFVLGGSGFNYAMTTAGQQAEGVRTYDNTVLPVSAGKNAITVTAGLELGFYNNIFDQLAAHAAVIDATTNPISGIKFMSNWFGASGTVAAAQDGVHFVGAPEFIPMIANTYVAWSGYGVNSGSGGVQHLPIVASKFYNNGAGDLNLNGVVDAVLLGNFFGSASGSWSQASEGSPLVAVGNRCLVAATGIVATDIILGDTTCAPNQIPALTITQALAFSALTFSNTPPTISSGFGSGAAIATANGTVAFDVNVGTGGSASSGVIGLPNTTHFWACDATDITTQSTNVFYTKQTARSATSATFTNYNTAGAATAWAASDHLSIKCVGM